ncbi:MAG TPA: hypothetical protein VEW46_00575 [Pyrinomonadaceae bacterium]|nr:hypothetical protein [Pyrinomonadaceae bacterium]
MVKKEGVLMALMRAVVLALLVTTVLCSAALAQRPGPQFRRELACEPFEPRTKLEAVESRYERVLLKGFSQIANLNVRGVVVRIDAVEMKDSASPLRAMGIVISLRGAEPARENRSYIDYEEIDPLLKAMESVARVSESVTKLASFEARYRTVGDFEVIVFRQGRASGTAASVSSGICDKVTGLLTLDELETLRAHIVEAKARLDEIK